MNPLIETIVSPDPALRNRPFRALCEQFSAPELLQACTELDQFRRGAENLYERVRASLFLYAAYRFVLQEIGRASCRERV